ncbi:MAG: 2OG-Fe(II) oxygenase [Myxococcota bacterium]
MEAHVYTEPQKHIIIDGFLDETMLARALEEILSLEPHLTQGRVVNQGQEKQNSFTKRNLNLWLDDHYRGAREASFLLSVFQEHFWSEPVRAALKATGDLLFEYVNHANRDCSLLSAYGHGDYYHDHPDEFPSLTANLFISTSPKRFTGGDFFLANTSFFEPRRIRRDKRIEFVPGRLVIFPSRTRHHVDKVVLPDNAFRHRRFSVQYWPSFVATP